MWAGLVTQCVGFSVKCKCGTPLLKMEEFQDGGSSTKHGAPVTRTLGDDTRWHIWKAGQVQTRIYHQNACTKWSLNQSVYRSLMILVYALVHSHGHICVGQGPLKLLKLYCNGVFFKLF